MAFPKHDASHSEKCGKAQPRSDDLISGLSNDERGREKNNALGLSRKVACGNEGKERSERLSPDENAPHAGGHLFACGHRILNPMVS